jgi:hypothetical protein
MTTITKDEKISAGQQVILDKFGYERFAKLEAWKAAALVTLLDFAFKDILKHPDRGTQAYANITLIELIIGTLECRNEEDLALFKAQHLIKMLKQKI